MNSRAKLDNLALKKGIKYPHEKTSEILAELLLSNESLNKKNWILLQEIWILENLINYHQIL